MSNFKKDDKVCHQQFGLGYVETTIEETSVVVRFEGGDIKICDENKLQRFLSVEEQLEAQVQTSPLEVVSHFQALAIRSANDKWGVFSPCKIDLLPHQLWVCRKARSMKPCQLLVADDVGLGKTIEAGLIISSFLHLKEKKDLRLLVLAPASLVAQWQERMKDMFDIRLEMHNNLNDTPKSDYWQVRRQVVASLHTLRQKKERRERFLQAQPWDLVIVDEAHHLNMEDHQKETLGHELLREMSERKLLNDVVFFTGTPHRGKDYGFFSLMQLLSPSFGPEKPKGEQLKLLGQHMIRNNKYLVTNMAGEKLFKVPQVHSHTYAYTEAETKFYQSMSSFILKGKAYAESLSQQEGQSVMLVLICMQKLASSSVAAIRNALKRRLRQAPANMKNFQNAKKAILECGDEQANADIKADQEEKLASWSSSLSLMHDEQCELGEVLKLADQVQEETKIVEILKVLRSEYPTEQVLFFTEYKATQRLLLEQLMRDYGMDSATFINGDGRLEDVRFPDGTSRRIDSTRQVAAEKFNRGACRFLVATEAAGEGIDLQRRCHVLFHVDLPWNPMRLHQRVGRVNRYGQKEQVIVHNFRNPKTVESRIWDILNAKIEEINQVFGAVMEEKEDLFPLILGMIPQDTITKLFAQGDEKAAARDFKLKIGDMDSIYQELKESGLAQRIDPKSLGQHLPQVDLQDLFPFFKNIMTFHRKRLNKVSEDSYECQIPKQWDCRGLYEAYSGLVFRREHQEGEVVMGVGFIVMDKALEQAQSTNNYVCSHTGLELPLLIWSVRDLHTDHNGEKMCSYYGVQLDQQGRVSQVLTDWRLLQLLNGLKVSQGEAPVTCDLPLADVKREAIAEIEKLLQREDFKPQRPQFVLEGALFP